MGGTAEEGGVVVVGGVDGAELLLLLLRGRHGRVLGLAHPVGQPGDRWVLGGEGPARARVLGMLGVLGEGWVGRCQVEVELLPLIG